MSLGAADGAERIYGDLVSVNYFSILGTRAHIGRLFTPEDGDQPGTTPFAVLSHHFWRRRFNGDPAVVGRSLQLNGHPFTVIGVAPEGFHGTTVLTTDVWVPVTMVGELSARRSASILTSREAVFLVMGARLKPGVTIGQAQAELATIARALEQEYPDANRGKGLQVLAVGADSGQRRPGRGVHRGADGAGGAGAGDRVRKRRRRPARARVRTPPGDRGPPGDWCGPRPADQADADRIVAPVPHRWRRRPRARADHDDGPGVAAPDAAAAARRVVAARRACVWDSRSPCRWLRRSSPVSRRRFTRSRAEVVGGLKADAQGGPERLRLRNAFVDQPGCVQHRAGRRRGTVRARAAASRAASIPASMPAASSWRSSICRSADIQRPPDLRSRSSSSSACATLPGVRDATMSAMMPLGMSRMGLGGLSLPGAPIPAAGPPGPPPPGWLNADWNVVEPDYFKTMKMPLVSGRDFTAGDRRGAPWVVIVNETAARQMWPNQSAARQGAGASRRPPRHAPDRLRPMTVIGVAKDAKYAIARRRHDRVRLRADAAAVHPAHDDRGARRPMAAGLPPTSGRSWRR